MADDKIEWDREFDNLRKYLPRAIMHVLNELGEKVGGFPIEIIFLDKTYVIDGPGGVE